MASTVAYILVCDVLSYLAKKNACFVVSMQALQKQHTVPHTSIAGMEESVKRKLLELKEKDGVLSAQSHQRRAGCSCRQPCDALCTQFTVSNLKTCFPFHTSTDCIYWLLFHICLIIILPKCPQGVQHCGHNEVRPSDGVPHGRLESVEFGQPYDVCNLSLQVRQNTIGCTWTIITRVWTCVANA